MKVHFIENNSLADLEDAVNDWIADVGNDVQELIGVQLSIGKNGAYIATISYKTT